MGAQVDRAQCLNHSQHVTEDSKEDEAIYLQHGSLGHDGVHTMSPMRGGLDRYQQLL